MTDGCSDVDGYASRYREFISFYPLVFLALPPLLGMFAGAPMFAREVEQGTHIFGLTQSISRRRWWTTKVLVGGLPVVAAMTGLGLLNSWALAPLRPLLSIRLMTPRFETEALTLGGYTLLAVVLGLTAGLWVRNTVAGMGITLAAYLVVLAAISNAARPAYLAPEVAYQPVAEFFSAGPVPPDAWRLDTMYLDAAGRETMLAGDCLSRSYGDDRANDVDCLRSMGLDRVAVWYQPDGRFWLLQAIEYGVTVLLSAALLGLGAWAVRRRLH